MIAPSRSPETRRLPPTWRQLHPDDDPRVEALQFARFRDAPGWEKMQIFSGLMRAARRLAVAGIRHRHPDASDEEVERMLAEMLLGPTLATRVWSHRAKSR